ncbi:hypothetical protein [Kibdelosporangium phytohabitans]|uniref:DUF2269 domain-containing protein n=1 Tax=Kibdelosporangium phytohabitans TaxID=860235 RepID=A0A0N9I510_9PSEU|nr:hypothetical protein [Kibdelosporangium phytohabitans]ALG09928.1 hypothetical protein AOZ06_26215 [Kibdelosporangium phytohabitans]MBE1468665.1 hypothetical protein [Kibdelosporangium phytohabitans]
MSQRNTLVRAMHDVGLAAWFGGSLAGAVAVNGAAADLPDPTMRLTVANAGWARWAPVNAVAVGVHLLGGTVLLWTNRDRVAGQRGVAAQTVAKLMLTGAALAATGYSGALGRKLRAAEGVAVKGGTTPAKSTPAEVAHIQQQLDTCQWLIPALTCGVSVLTALAGEQQRSDRQLAEVITRPGRWLRAAG